jgi:hypothetical protein
MPSDVKKENVCNLESDYDPVDHMKNERKIRSYQIKIKNYSCFRICF